MKNSILFFTSYPRKGQVHDKKIVGGASYTKKLLTYLTKEKPDLRLMVYCEQFGKKKETYRENFVTVKRSWRRGNPFSVIKAVWDASREQAETIAVSYEVNMVGGPIINMVFLLSLLMSKIGGKKIIFIPHQVVEDFHAIEDNNLKAEILNVMKSFLFGYISAISDQIIVFEDYLKKALPDPRKAVSIPLAVEKLSVPSRMQARRKLKIPADEFVMLFFGFLSPYKGIDDVLDTYDNKNGLLILAGDGNPNHMNKQWYKEYIRNIKMKAQEKGALTPGFIPEEDIALYYAASDVLVLPYRIFFSSSYPLSLAMSYETPVIISKSLEGYFTSEHFQTALKEAGLNQNDIVIDYKKDFQKTIKNIKQNKNKYIDFSKKVKELRSWDKIARQFAGIFKS